MTKMDAKEGTPKRGSRRGLVVGLVVVLGVVLAVVAFQLLPSPNEDPGVAASAESDLGEENAEQVHPYEALLVDYAAARNAGDIDSLAGYFTSRAEQKRHPLEPWDGGKRHPLDPLGYLNGLSEIRQIEGQVPAVQGSGSGVEFFDVKINENPVAAPDVQFKWRFHYGADGSESGGEAGCSGGERGAAFIQNGEFAVLDWGYDDPTACEG